MRTSTADIILIRALHEYRCDWFEIISSGKYFLEMITSLSTNHTRRLYCYACGVLFVFHAYGFLSQKS